MAEATLDDIAALVGFFVVANAPLAIGFAGDDRLNPPCFEDVTKRIGVISFIGDKLSDSGRLWPRAVLSG